MGDLRNRVDSSPARLENIALMTQTLRFLAIYAIAGLSGQVCAATVHSVVRPSTGDIFQFSVPDWARIQSVSVSVAPTGSTQIALAMAAPPPATRSGRWAVELLFSSPYVQTPYDVGVFFLPAGGESVSQVFPENSAWLVDLVTQQVLGQVLVHVDGSLIVFTFPSGTLTNSHLVLSVSRYLPPGLQDVPLGASLVSLALQQQQGAPPRRPGKFPFPYELPASSVPIKLPDTAPVTWPGWRDEDDVNHDGRTDYDLEPDTRVTGDWIVGVWVLDLPFWYDEYAVYLGRDTNGNGRLDPSEILYQVGQCPLPSGADLGDIYVREDGTFVIVWEVQQPQNDGPWIIRYVYDSSRPVQERLRVYVKRGDNSPWELAWCGNPLLYPWEDRDTRVGHDFPEPPQGGDLVFVPVCGRVTS